MEVEGAEMKLNEPRRQKFEKQNERQWAKHVMLYSSYSGFKKEGQFFFFAGTLISSGETCKAIF